MIEFIIAHIYAVSGSILLACFVGYINWRNNLKSRQAAIASAFRAAFAPELTALSSPTRTKTVRGILVSGFTRHNEAAITFRQTLCWFNRRGFDKAWQQYHSGHSIDADAWGIPKEEQLFLDYFSIKNDKKAAEVFLSRIYKVLYYARQT
jgi:hypothetical protein